jgi:large subunit ribosomal protein L29
MAIIRKNDLKKMNKTEMQNKLKELKLELAKAGVSANKASAKTKELKRTVARLLTILNKPKSGELKTK